MMSYSYCRTVLYLALILCAVFSDLSGGIEDYFKKVPEKSDIHRIKNVDFIYMINLDERPEKFERCIAQLYPYMIYPCRFSAVNGWELSLEALNELGVKFCPGMDKKLMGTSYLPGGNFEPHHEKMQNIGQTYFCHCMARGTIGIVLSHLSVLQDAIDSGYETIWVMEDDIKVIKDPHLISKLIKKLDAKVGKNNWDILFTDQDTKDANGKYVPCHGFAKRPNYSPKNQKRFRERTEISADFRRVGARYGAYSMIIRRSGMKKIADFIKTHNIFLPYDIDFYLPEDIKMFTVTSDIVSTQPRAPSDNGAPRYLDKD